MQVCVCLCVCAGHKTVCTASEKLINAPKAASAEANAIPKLYPNPEQFAWQAATLTKASGRGNGL